MTSDKPLSYLYDSLCEAHYDYYREYDVRGCGWEAEGFEAAEEIFKLPADERIFAIESVTDGMTYGTPEARLKYAAAEFRLAELERDEPKKTDWLAMFSDMVSGPQVPEGFR